MIPETFVNYVIANTSGLIHSNSWPLKVVAIAIVITWIVGGAIINATAVVIPISGIAYANTSPSRWQVERLQSRPATVSS